MDGISPKIESVLSNGFSSAFDISIHKLVTTFFTPQLTHINNIDNNMQNSHIHSSLLRNVHTADIYHSMDHGYWIRLGGRIVSECRPVSSQISDITGASHWLRLRAPGLTTRDRDRGVVSPCYLLFRGPEDGLRNIGHVYSIQRSRNGSLWYRDLIIIQLNSNLWRENIKS